MNIPLATHAPSGRGLKGTIVTLRQVNLPVPGVGSAGGSKDSREAGLRDLGWRRGEIPPRQRGAQILTNSEGQAMWPRPPREARPRHRRHLQAGEGVGWRHLAPGRRGEW